MSLFRMLAQFIREHWRAYASSAVMLSGVAAFSVLIPRSVGHIIDRLVARDLPTSALILQLVLLTAMGVAIYLLRVGWRLRLYSAAYELGAGLRTRLYRTLATQGPGFFQDQRTGDLMARATNDIDAVEMAAGEAVLAGFDGTVTFVLVLAMMTAGVDWRLALAALLPFPFMAFGFWRISNRLHHAWGDSLRAFSMLNDHVQESLTGIRTVRALGLQSHNAHALGELAEAAARTSVETQRWEAAFSPIVGVALTLSTVLTLGVGGYFVWHHSLSIGSLTSFTMYLGQLIWPMFAAGWVLSLLERGRAAWGRLHPLLAAPPSIADAGTRRALPPQRIDFQRVRFDYRATGESAALDAISLSIDAGQTIGIAGPTGAGKSTLLRLLLRQHVPSDGEIHWNGAPLDQYTLDSLRHQVSWVPQEAFLFSATIAENIALARPTVSASEIEHVARLAAVHDDILRLPQGYATPVGEKGVTLSGGQRQRVAIARALLAEAPLLLLDDALSAVDTGTETDILRHLRAARHASGPARTVVIVSHRLSALADADRIVVLRDGRVAESGSHDELLAADAWYARQWRYQQLEASLEIEEA